MDLLKASILAVIEGVTEYLPISSTGHLIIASALMGINEEAFVKSFNVIIQFGAILSVFVLYWARLRAPLSFYLKIAIGFLPAATLGLLVKDYVDLILGSVEVVALSLFVGGVILLFVDDKLSAGKKNITQLTYRDALLIGLCQCFAFIPGVSRSAASIVGGMVFGLSKREAAEFSFFLAVPTLTGATLIKSLKVWPTIEAEQIYLLIFGTFISFVVACIAIRGFVGLISTRGFKIFGIYRILLSLVIAAMMGSGWALTH